MNVAKLIERLSECDPNAEVRLATQPNWPLAAHLLGVADGDEVAVDCDRCEDLDDCPLGDACPVVAGTVWLVEGAQPTDSPYAPREAWSVAR